MDTPSTQDTPDPSATRSVPALNGADPRPEPDGTGPAPVSAPPAGQGRPEPPADRPVSDPPDRGTVEASPDTVLPAPAAAAGAATALR
ncbi:hypothetical protein AAFH96_36885, partial [Polymorphospora sp. 2-325]